MPRIRTIKPEFWTDGTMVTLSPLARLFYIGTWTFSLCDKGHLEDDPVRLKLQILPAEAADVSVIIDELIDAGRLTRITAGDRTYLQVTRLNDHQKADARWTPRCPACMSLTETPRNSPKLPVTHPNSPELAETHGDSPQEGKGREGKVSNTSAAADRFDEFYQPYPRKEAPGDARKAWKAAVKKTDADTIIAGLVAQLPEMGQRDRKFIKLPASWLRAECWLNEAAKDDEHPYAHVPAPKDWNALRAEAQASRGGAS